MPAEVGGRFVAGTAGYIAPEQVLDPVELDPRADVYALAATIYNVTTSGSRRPSRSSSARDPAARPGPMEFGRAFAAAL